jgi:NADH/NAD ratio-sensing transcriptional regulator Rex
MYRGSDGVSIMIRQIAQPLMCRKRDWGVRIVGSSQIGIAIIQYDASLHRSEKVNAEDGIDDTVA